MYHEFTGKRKEKPVPFSGPEVTEISILWKSAIDFVIARSYSCTVFPCIVLFFKT